MVASHLRQGDTAFDTRLDDLEAGHGLLAGHLGERRQQWGCGLGAALRRAGG